MAEFKRRWWTWGDDCGSNVAQAAAVAIMAAVLIGALLLGARELVPGVDSAFRCLASTLSGGAATCGGIGGEIALGGPGDPLPATQPQPPDVPCPALPGAGYREHNQPQDTASLYRLINSQYQGAATADQQRGPIGITQIGDNRYLVSVAGIEALLTRSRFNHLGNSVLDEVGIQSQYQAHVRDILAAQIPPGAELVLAGHSHGGMVLQNLARDAAIREQFQVTHVITYGSPVTGQPADGTDYTMYEINGDIVPGAAIVRLPSFIRLYWRGDYHIIPSDQFYWNPLDYHSKYAEALEALRNDRERQQLLQLPFTIDRWGPTKTYQANPAAADQLRRYCG